jgi:hypothetical protein
MRREVTGARGAASLLKNLNWGPTDYDYHNYIIDLID